MNIFRNKITPFKDIFPNGFVDIHSHLLNGIDDGAKTLDESIELSKQFQELGMTDIITTPHVLGELWPNTPELITDRLHVLQNELTRNGLENFQIKAAAEYMIDDAFIKLLKEKKLLTIGDNFLLIELPFYNAPENLNEIIFNIQTNGFKPILAHPERYFYYHNKIKDLVKLRDIGCFFQLNLLSLTKHYGNDVYKIAVYLLKNNFIDFLGTDIHNTNHIDKLKKLGTSKNVKLLEPYILKNEIFRPFKKTLF